LTPDRDSSSRPTRGSATATRTPRAVLAGSVGILGGTFDPIHVGHLAAAEEVRESLGLERVLFVPAGVPPHKPNRRVTAAADRIAMVQLAIEGNAAFEVSRVEVDRPGPSWTADTVELLADAERRAGRSPDLTVILSVESFRGLPTWREPARLLEAARVAVVPRGGFPAPDEAWVEEQFPGLAERVVFLDAPQLRLSATEIRERVETGRSIRYLVPEAVRRYIGDHDLYRDAQGRDGSTT
jgi:nicotinate-nucleotide adenylyltransferase